ncbi:MAG: PAS domain S-box protein [Elusimicrobiota bacterium]|jgi:PAS domain S-box-containing protein
MMRLQSNSFRMICELTPHPIWVVDPTSCYFLEVNEAARAQYGYSRDEFLSLKIPDIHAPKDHARLLEMLSATQGPKQRVATLRQKTKDGRLIDVEMTARPMEFDGRKAVICMVSDVTERVRSQKDLQQHRLAMESACDGMAILREDETYEFLNTAHAKIYGYGHPSELLGKSWRVLYDDEERRRFETEIMPALYRDGRWHGEAAGLRKDGARFPQELSLTVLPEGGLVCIVRDISERTQVQSVLLQQKAAIESAGDGIFILADDRTFSFVNDAFVRLHGGKIAEFPGKPWQDFYPADEFQRFLSEALPVLKRDGRWRGEAVGLRSDGARFNQELALTLMREGGCVGVVRDVTERKRLDAELARALACEKTARQDAEQAVRAKDEFLAILSHEMRTPMTAMLGWSWLLRTGSLDGDAREKAFEVVYRNMQQQAQIIEDLLDISRIVTGKLHLDARMLDLKPVLEAVLENIRPAAEAKSIRVDFSCEETLPPLLGDPDRLQQAFWNLLANALKFTPEGGSVRVELGRVGSRLQVRISDTGQGIPPEQLRMIFDIFRQGEEALTRKFRGLGLGLALVRMLVEAHGGSVEASSPGLGRGSLFTLYLPVPALRIDARSAAAGERPSLKLKTEDLPRLEGVRVLVVDDDETTRSLACAVLKGCGAEVSLASSSKEAWELLQKDRPTVLVSDIAMPEEDGVALIRKLRAKGPKEGDIPAVAMIAAGRAGERVRVLLSGFQLSIPKPLEPLELAAAVANLSGRSLTSKS